MRLSSLTKSLIGLTAVVVRCAAPAPRVPESTESARAVTVESTSVTPASDAPRESSAVARPVARETMWSRPAERPLASEFRERLGSNFPYVAIVDSYPTSYHGKFYIVVGRGMTADSTVSFSIDVANEAMTELGVAVGSTTGPWPDFTVHVDSVTPDSVYLTGTSASYRRSVKHAYRWWPTGDFTPPHGPPATATTTPVCGDTVRVDLDAKTIAGIWINQPIEPVKRQVGAANVIADTAYAEGGEPVLEYTIKLCGHQVRRSWNSASWHDPVFRTPEGLGVGSTLAAFDTAYGKGEAIGEEGESVRYWPPNSFGYFFLEVPDRCYGDGGRRMTVERSCRVTEISFIIFDRP